jgi:hypothetical protein
MLEPGVTSYTKKYTQTTVELQERLLQGRCGVSSPESIYTSWSYRSFTVVSITTPM